ncbi:N-6 DNA methylase [Acidovorax sp.]|uniref:N-6 DNA methylase n=1 Tax=Acidovorax sp. TaxID=1872122 RepID=UPI00391F2D14
MAEDIFKIGPAGHKKRITGLLRDNARRHRLSEVFSDFCEVAALAISNAVDIPQFKDREARYLDIVGRYEREEVERFPAMLAALTAWMECAGMADCLGELFMSLELGDSFKGQFFTPYEVSRLMAGLTLGQDAQGQIDAHGYLRVSEPTCGAGGMAIAMADALQSQQINYQQCMHVTAQDIDRTAVHMTYLQLSLLHVPAVVILGNTLSMEVRERWYTPAHILGGWGARLRNRNAQVPVPQILELAPVGAARVEGAAVWKPAPAALDQLALF